MGWSEQAIEKELAEDDADVFEIWPEHIDAWSLFLAVQRRWVYPAMANKPIGLDCDWVKLKVELMFPRKRRREIVSQLELIEAGALEKWPTKS